MAKNRRRNRRQRALPAQQLQQTANFIPAPGQIRRGLGVSISRSQYSGPLPPPEILQAIDDACPGGAGRVITQMEEQGRHRRSLETIVVTGDDRREDKGQIFGFVLCLTVVIGGVVLLALGINLGGYIALIGGLGLPAGLFVYKKIEAKQELQHKKDALQKPKQN